MKKMNKKAFGGENVKAVHSFVTPICAALNILITQRVHT